MPESHSRKQIIFTYVQTNQILDEIVRKNFFEWTQNLDGQYLKKLQQTLLVRIKGTPSRLEINFDK